MILLLTSDWQADHHNLDLCEISLKELLAHAKKHKPDAIIHAGDLKDAYNPVDIRVAKFWVRATREITKRGYRFIVLLGNHDRISQSSESKNWLDILRAAGAEIVTVPKWKKVRDGAVAFLPYTSDKKQEADWADQLLETAPEETPNVSVLIFHTELKGAKLNSFGTEADGNTVSALHSSSYAACFGGHLHGHQKVAENVWYIGSPFTMDWGESNEFKGHVLYDSEAKSPVRHLVTKIPHWYDAEWLEREPDKDWLQYGHYVPEKGAYIRSRVKVSSKKITEQLREEEARLKKLYPACIIHVVPLIEPAEEQEIMLSGATEEEKVSAYVASTIPDAVHFTAEAGAQYLTNLIGSMVPGRSTGPIRLVSVYARDVLCFHEVNLKYSKQGLVLLKGVNKDWPKQSNGSGKTSLLSLLPVAMFGSTLKGQKNDEWAREDRNGNISHIRLTLRQHDGTWIEIIRTRPHSLILRRNKEDISSGLTGKGKHETQGMIEQLTGYDMHMLTNAIYIDQTIANGFVFGTNKDRMDLVNKLLDLGRFEAALDKVKQNIISNEKLADAVQVQIDKLTDQIDSLQDDIAELKETEVHDWSKKATQTRKQLDTLLKQHADYSASQQFYDDKQQELDALHHDADVIDGKLQQLSMSILAATNERKKYKKLAYEGKCYVCHQPTAELASNELKTITLERTRLQEERQKLKNVLDAKNESILAAEEQVSSYRKLMADLEQEIAKTRIALQHIEAAEAEEHKRNAEVKKKRFQLLAEQKTKKKQRKNYKQERKQLSEERELLEYAKKACSRTGMPMHLAASLCPLLNNAAAEYAEIFFSSKINVRFAVEEGEFCCNIVNPAGSSSSSGQSVGESAMAGIICSFALREAAPKTNLLVMDEPGSGLDPVAARQFAHGLLKLKDRWDTIIVVTHNPIIESVLSGEKQWIVQKEQGISRLLL
jgi:DNA repair protein SbcD/Mre11